MSAPARRRVHLLAGLLTLVTVAGIVLAGALRTSTPVVAPGEPAVGADGRVGAATGESRPANVVLVVLDDFSTDLLPAMSQAGRMQREGAVFPDTFVVNTLCCPSRAATLTGLPPHLNGVLTNTADGPTDPKGGFDAFVAHGNTRRSLNVSLDRAGYRTGFVGKLLNEYEPARFEGSLPLLPGWDDFEALTGAAYSGWGFSRTERVGRRLVLHDHPTPPASASPATKDGSYAGTVIGDRAVSLLRSYEAGADPFFLYVAPYAPHSRLQPAWPGEPVFPAAVGDRPSAAHPAGNCGPLRCTDLRLRDLEGYGDDPSDNAPTYLSAGSTSPAPSWRSPVRPLGDDAALRHYRDRARMVQSVDRMLRQLLDEAGPDTYVILTSDNGYHLGQHGLGGGKGTPYDSDTRVPLLVVGPGVEPGERAGVASNLDLAPTIEDLAHAEPSGPRTGTSLVPALRTASPTGSRFAFVEHTHGPRLPGEPDGDIGSGGRLDAIPSYVAVRSARGLLVRLDLDDSWTGTDHAWELYDYADSRYEQRNVFAQRHPEPWVRDLMDRLRAWEACAPAECRSLTR